ncbi:YkuS family protein [Shouchella sp. 1P09AA]|uniref:YkuS family protein n=1 Tax=unclassified Shouchella TaxID=2893065 RepID=UPI0039A2B562
MAKIGVQSGLTDIENELQTLGYDVVHVKNETDASGCDCCVVSGRDADVAGMSPQGSMSIVSADGLSAQEVGQRVEQTLSNQNG